MKANLGTITAKTTLTPIAHYLPKNGTISSRFNRLFNQKKDRPYLPTLKSKSKIQRPRYRSKVASISYVKNIKSKRPNTALIVLKTYRAVYWSHNGRIWIHRLKKWFNATSVSLGTMTFASKDKR